MIRSLGVLLATVLATGGLLGSSADAHPPEVMKHCGRVHEYIAPTTGAAGKIVLGTRSLQIATGQAPIEVGSEICIFGEADRALNYGSVEVSPIPSEVCGQVDHVVLSAGEPGGLVLLLPGHTNFQMILKLAVGDGRELEENVETCVAVAVDAEGDAVVSSRQAGATASPSGLPSTNSAASPAPQILLGSALFLAVALLIAARRAFLRPRQ